MKMNENKFTGDSYVPASVALRESRVRLAREIFDDPNKFTEYADKVRPRLMRLSINILHNSEDAKDAVQDGLLNVWKGLRGYNGGSALDTWTYRIAVNTSLMALRRRDKSREGQNTTYIEENISQSGEGVSLAMQIPEKRRGPHEEFLKDEVSEKLNKAILKLPSNLRIVFILQKIDGLSTQETAEILDISVPAVKSRMLRANQNMRVFLEEYMDGRGKASRSNGAKQPVSIATNGLSGASAEIRVVQNEIAGKPLGRELNSARSMGNRVALQIPLASPGFTS